MEQFWQSEYKLRFGEWALRHGFRIVRGPPSRESTIHQTGNTERGFRVADSDPPATTYGFLLILLLPRLAEQKSLYKARNRSPIPERVSEPRRCALEGEKKAGLTLGGISIKLHPIHFEHGMQLQRSRIPQPLIWSNACVNIPAMNISPVAQHLPNIRIIRAGLADVDCSEFSDEERFSLRTFLESQASIAAVSLARRAEPQFAQPLEPFTGKPSDPTSFKDPATFQEFANLMQACGNYLLVHLEHEAATLANTAAQALVAGYVKHWFDNRRDKHKRVKKKHARRGTASKV